MRCSRQPHGGGPSWWHPSPIVDALRAALCDDGGEPPCRAAGQPQRSIAARSCAPNVAGRQQRRRRSSILNQSKGYTALSSHRAWNDSSAPRVRYWYLLPDGALHRHARIHFSRYSLHTWVVQHALGVRRGCVHAPTHVRSRAYGTRQGKINGSSPTRFVCVGQRQITLADRVGCSTIVVLHYANEFVPLRTTDAISPWGVLEVGSSAWCACRISMLRPLHCRSPGLSTGGWGGRSKSIQCVRTRERAVQSVPWE